MRASTLLFASTLMLLPLANAVAQQPSSPSKPAATATKADTTKKVSPAPRMHGTKAKPSGKATKPRKRTTPAQPDSSKHSH